MSYSSASVLPRLFTTLTALSSLTACATAARPATEPSPDFGPPGDAVLDPAVPPFVMGMMDHADRFGFSADSREFGYCMTDGGAGATRCGFLDASGRRTDASDFDRNTGEPNPRLTDELARHMARDQAPPGAWRYARDLVLVWEVTGLRDPANPLPDEAPPPVLRVGARVRTATATAAALPIAISASRDADTIHPETIVVSPDGLTLAVLSHDFAGEFSDHFEVRTLPTAELARSAYEAAAHERQAAGDLRQAKVWSELAAQCDAGRYP
ncbi:MAG TPA: hypothetical protein VNN72_12225 [Polyangiaceae bacterium]|nr:hypothetical protein [Polyangiaceae bacterium]